MSLVGPRPALDWEARDVRSGVPAAHRRAARHHRSVAGERPQPAQHARHASSSTSSTSTATRSGSTSRSSARRCPRSSAATERADDPHRRPPHRCRLARRSCCRRAGACSARRRGSPRSPTRTASRCQRTSRSTTTGNATGGFAFARGRRLPRLAPAEPAVLRLPRPDRRHRRAVARARRPARRPRPPLPNPRHQRRPAAPRRRASSQVDEMAWHGTDLARDEDDDLRAWSPARASERAVRAEEQRRRSGSAPTSKTCARFTSSTGARGSTSTGCSRSPSRSSRTSGSSSHPTTASCAASPSTRAT